MLQQDAKEDLAFDAYQRDGSQLTNILGVGASKMQWNEKCNEAQLIITKMV